MKAHPSLKPALWGAVAGAVAISVIGFLSMGWTLGSTAERMAADRAESAVVSVLAPICVEKFQQQANSAAKLIEFKKAASWDQRAFLSTRSALAKRLRRSARNNWRRSDDGRCDVNCIARCGLDTPVAGGQHVGDALLAYLTITGE
jgi:hypothetical protein